MTGPRCERLEREGLADLDQLPDELAAHVAGCADCTAALAEYRRITGTLVHAGERHARRGDHLARLFARERARRRRRLLVPLGAAVAVAAAAVIWLRLPGTPPRFAVDALDGTGAVYRGDGHLGDRLRVRTRDTMAIWIYRNEHELLLACPPACRTAGGERADELPLDAIGRYQIVWLSSPAVVPTGDLERDIAAAASAGAQHELREIEVR